MLEIAITISFLLLSAALVLSFIRLALGPTFPDRVMTLDLIVAVVLGFIGVYSLSSRVSDFLDMAMVISLMGFLGTVAFSRFIQHGRNEK